MSNLYQLSYKNDDTDEESFTATDITIESGAVLHGQLDEALTASASSIRIVHVPISVQTAIDDLGASLWNAVKPIVQSVAPPTTAVEIDVTQYFPINVPATLSGPPQPTGFPNIESVRLVVTLLPSEE